MPAPADWQLPPGVTRELWDYFQDTRHAVNYDAGLAATPLLAFDLEFVDQWTPSPGRVLDLGCGTGRAAIRMAKRGATVLGVDLSPPMLAEASRKASATGSKIDFLQANIAELDSLEGGSFDTVLCLFATLGMVAGPEARRAVLRHASRVLKPGGRLILHVHNRWWNLRTRTTVGWFLRDQLRSLSGVSEAGDFQMPDHDGRPGWAMHLFTSRELHSELGRAGFEVRSLCPIGICGPLSMPWFFGEMRAYGFLVAADRNVAC